MSETAQRTTARQDRRNGLWTTKNRPRQFIATPLGHKLTRDEFFKPLADFLAGRFDEQPDEPPGFLREPIRQLDDPMFLALAGLASLLDGIFRGWDLDDPSAGAKLKLRVGNDLHHRLRAKVTPPPRWGEKERLQAGDWLLSQAMRLDLFGYDEDGCPTISDIDNVEQIRLAMIAADPAYAPLVLPPEPWTGLEKSCESFRDTFVRDWRPQTKKSIADAFLAPFEHAGGVNALSMVPLRLDPVMVDLVERFAVDLMDNTGAQRQADQVTVAADVADARYIGKRVVWCDYNCDRRGRIYALGHFNFARADHVRSLFRFTSGMPLTDTYWLEIHCANCFSADKRSRPKRIEWVDTNRENIRAIAEDPVGTFDRWRKAKEPFAYVAACRELAAAWDDPDNFVTRLPIAFDGTANGLQHLAMLAGDTAAAALVNLLPDGNDDPSDAYKELITRARELIEADQCDHAIWWRKCFEVLSAEDQRKLLKQPIMTFAYSVTPSGATKQIFKVYKSLRRNEKPPNGAFLYLANKVLEACKLELPGLKTVMDYICDIAEHRTSHGRLMEWTSPSGFPVENRYQKLNLITVTCLRGEVRVAQHKIADGVTAEINRNKVKFSAAPNFVHSLDAAHLIKVVNAAAREGIMDLLTVHDCYYCLAPQATRLHEIILEQLDNLYRDNDPLAELRSRNVSGDILPVPPKGTLITAGLRPGRAGILPLDGLIVTTTRNGDGYDTRVSFSPERVRDAKNAFG
jgi:hypothetical protein